MLTAMLATKNILGENHDLWAVNTDQEYHEEITDLDEKAEKVSEWRPAEPVSDEVLARAFARIDKLAFATAVGSACGLAVLIATLWLVIKGGEVIGSNLQLLGKQSHKTEHKNLTILWHTDCISTIKACNGPYRGPFYRYGDTRQGFSVVSTDYRSGDLPGLTQEGQGAQRHK